MVMKTLKAIADGAARGRRANTGMRDLTTGRVFFQNASHADDAAREMGSHLRERKGWREQEKADLERIARALERSGGR